MTSVELQDLYELSPEGQRLLFTDAKTGYNFSAEQVPDDRLRAIYELFKWAPTSANINPMRVLYVRTPEGKERLPRGNGTTFHRLGAGPSSPGPGTPARSPTVSTARDEPPRGRPTSSTAKCTGVTAPSRPSTSSSIGDSPSCTG